MQKKLRTENIVPAEKIKLSPVFSSEEMYDKYPGEPPPTKSPTKMPENPYLCRSRPNRITISPKKLFNPIPEVILLPFFMFRNRFLTQW